MSAQPKYRNFFKHDFLVEAYRNEAWTQDTLDQIGGGKIWNAYIFVLSPTYQWVFVDSPEAFDRAEFCDWVETVSGTTIVNRNDWPNIELSSEPPEDWRARALEMPCRTGPNLWEKLTTRELHSYVRGKGLPDDIDERGEPDDVH